jgi:hypothetical protein
MSTALTTTQNTLTTATSWADVVTAIRKIQPTEAPVPTQAKRIALSGKQVESLLSLAEHANDLPIPTERSALTASQRRELIHAMQTLKDAKATCQTVDTELKAAWHGHFDATAEELSLVGAETPRHRKNGWYLVEDKHSGAVEGEPETVVREVRGGKTELTEAGLAKLETQGVIDHETYLRCTKQVRVVNEDAVVSEIARRADPEFAAKLVAVSEQTDPTVAISLRKAK